ncbi:cell wall hydrolase [Chengkuizengella sp. 2205SS18-9]|uniref:Cell wall hydrolase n=1 Tax=Chengkuizengella axinellae TaxID=3064388 RepID=A0ABT9J6W2_9BACL|nr:cell wall hydrolase [Chengkuizengella sp. 2205SS18-9]MDP5276704.1 cell wall hydrolase [Chengkuizengella sp. 2205SS18-9]
MSKPIVEKESRIYVPIRIVVDHFGAEVTWNKETEKATIQTSNGDQIIVKLNDLSIKLNGDVYYMDVPTMAVNDHLYIPVRHLTEFLHANFQYDAANNQMSVSTIPLHVITAGETVESISAQYGITVEELKTRNNLTTNELFVNNKLKIVIPSIMQYKLSQYYTEEDALLLAKIISAEAGYEPYEGQLAVGNVILNRVNDTRFPNTIKDVIYAPNQFGPAHRGELEGLQPSAESIRAAQEVLAGKNIVEGALYFFNPAVSSTDFFLSKEVVREIGGHRFVK